MFEAAEDRAASGEPLALRNLALLELLYGSGLRATELVSLPRGALRVGPAVPDPARQGRQGAAGADLRRAPRQAVERWLRACAGVSRSGCSRAARRHLSRVRLFQIVRAMAARRRNPARAGQPARPAPRFRDASAVGRRRPARAPVAARPRRHRDHANLHPCRQRAAGRAGQHPPPAGDRPSLTERSLRRTPRRQC